MGASTEFAVKGMTCDHCARAVTEQVTRLPGVTAVDVDVAAGRVAVTSDTSIDEDAMRVAVEEAGYELG